MKKRCELAKNLYEKIVETQFRQRKQGYFEAFNQDLSPIERFTPAAKKDANLKKRQ